MNRKNSVKIEGKTIKQTMIEVLDRYDGLPMSFIAEDHDETKFLWLCVEASEHGIKYICTAITDQEASADTHIDTDDCVTLRKLFCGAPKRPVCLVQIIEPFGGMEPNGVHGEILSVFLEAGSTPEDFLPANPNRQGILDS